MALDKLVLYATPVALCIFSFLAGMNYPSDLSRAEQIILAVHDAHDYDYENETYTCFNYSRDAVMELRRAGIEAYFMRGEINSTMAHAWVKYCFDRDVTAGNAVPDYSLYNRIVIRNVTQEGQVKAPYSPWLDEQGWCNQCVVACNITGLLDQQCGQAFRELKYCKAELDPS